MQGLIFRLRLERGGGQQILLSCACFLITQPFLNIYRHAIYQIKAEYHSYLVVAMILYNLSEVKLKIERELKKKLLFFGHRFLIKLTTQNNCTQSFNFNALSHSLTLKKYYIVLHIIKRPGNNLFFGISYV